MMKKTLFLTLSFLIVLPVWALAGSGSDTVGAGTVLPQLRYSYSAWDWDTDSAYALPLTGMDISAHDYYLQINWGVHPNVDVYAVVGGRSVSMTGDSGTDELRTGPVPMFMWGVGVKGTFYRADSGFYVGGGLRFLHSFTDDYSMKTYSGGVLVDETEDVYSTSVIRVTPDIHIGWHFTDIGLTPYLGLEYNWERAYTRIGLGGGYFYTHDFEPLRPLMMYGGLDWSLGEKFYLNAEARSNFIDAWGVETGLGYRFDINDGRDPGMNSPFLGGGGNGSDTIGVCRLLPQLRYSYSAWSWDTGSVFALPLTGMDVSAHDYYLQINWGVHPNVDVYAVVGGRSISMTGDSGTDELRTGPVPTFMWGVGVKGTFYRADSGFYVGGGLRFLHSFTDDYSMKTYSGGVLVDETEDVYSTSVIRVTPDIHIGWHFTDIGLTPYLGLEYNWERAYTRIGLGGGYCFTYEFDHNRPLMMYAGLDWYLGEKFYLNAEGRSNFTNGWGAGIGIGYLFDICAKPARGTVTAPAPIIEPKLEPMSKK